MSKGWALSRRTVLAGAAGGLVATGLAGCTAGPGEGAAPGGPTAAFTPVALTGDWSPAPVRVAGLQSLATAKGTTLALHTRERDVTFWAGVNVGSTTPGHSPGELAVDRATYRRWFSLMAQLGVRFLRIYTIHFPHFYEELAAYNLAYPSAPLYLIHGIYLPDESYIETGNLYAAEPTRAMVAEVRDASAAVHGTLRRPVRRGAAHGTWTADVSRWTAAWIVGVEWDPTATLASDAANAAAPAHRGKYFRSAAKATPTERWIAARLDELAGYEAARGVSVPIAHANWPTADPLRHPDEPLDMEDMVSVDANHIQPTAAWPGGTFASYHAYPYYPDFQALQPSYARPIDGVIDPYRAYLADLQRHHGGMPVMISEFGVPSSLGSAHRGTNGRDQGHHTETEAMAMDAAMLTMLKTQGLAGGMVFSWADEWFKFTWNTAPRHAVVHSERRALWHDPLTNEQFFGVLAVDPRRVGRRVIHEARDGVHVIGLDHDASWVYLDIDLAATPSGPVVLGFDVIPSPGLALPGAPGTPGASSSEGVAAQEACFDVAVTVDVAAGTARCLIRADLDPVLMDGLPRSALPAAQPDGWTLQRMTLSAPRIVPTTRRATPVQFLDVGVLRRGRWDPGSGRDSMATWDFTPGSQGGPAQLLFRLPWSLLAISDPSSLTALVPTPDPQGGTGPHDSVRHLPTGVVISGITLHVQAAGMAPVRAPIRWEGWNRVAGDERLKDGVQVLAAAMVSTSG
jgi:hypothetical protein